MSVENFIHYLEASESNEGLRQKFAEAVAKAAQDAGFDVSAQDVLAAVEAENPEPPKNKGCGGGCCGGCHP